MFTLFNWYRMKSKEIKLKLAFYSLLEQGMEEISNNKDSLGTEPAHGHAMNKENGSQAAP